MKTTRSALQNCAQALAVASLLLGLQTSSAAQPVVAPPGIIAWWPGDGNANDIFGTNHGVLLGGATASAVGEAGQAFDLNGTSAYAEVTDSPSLDLPGSMTIEMWVMPYVPLSEQLPWARLVDKNNGELGQYGWILSTSGSQNDDPTQGHGNISWGCYDGQWHGIGTPTADSLWPYQFSHLAVTYDQQSGWLALYTNSQMVVGYNAGNFRIPRVSNPLRIGANNWAGIGGFFKGRIDEVTLYNRALGSNEIAAIYDAGSAGKCKDPLIMQHPQTQIGYWGKSATFTVAAKGTQPLRYQWLKNGVIIPGATNSALTLTNLQATNSGAYSVTVSNSVRAITTNPGLLEVSVVEMEFALYAGILIKGVVGQTYGVQATTNLAITNSWIGLTNLTLTTPTYLWYDSQPASLLQRYYRIVPGPIPIP